MKPNTILFCAAILGAIGVITGAFGAHALKERLTETSLDAYRTGVLYLFIHAIAMMLTGLIGLTGKWNPWLRRAAPAFLFGIILFSGSLFLLSTSALTGITLGVLGPLTPLGGLCFITGWIFLAVGFFTQ